MTVTIRYAEEGEVAALTAIELDADQRYADSAHPEIANGDRIPIDALACAVRARQVVVAVEDGAILGWLLLTRSGDEICIGQISVRRAAGGQGVGTRLLDTIVESSRGAGHKSIVLNTQADVPWNRPWYEPRGTSPLPICVSRRRGPVNPSRIGGITGSRWRETRPLRPQTYRSSQSRPLR